MTTAAIDQGWPLLTDLALKSCLLSIAGGIGLLMLRRQSPAARHFALLLTFTMLLALPVLSFVLPRWQVNWQSRFAQEAGSRSIVSRIHAPVVTPQQTIVPSPPESLSLHTDSLPEAASSAPIVSQIQAVGPAKSVSPSRFSITATTLRQLALTLWGVGLMAMLMRLLFGLIATHRLHQQGAPVVDDKLRQLAATVQREMGLSGVISLRQTQSNSTMCVPLSYGWMRPTILLPRYLLDWSPERQKLVLYHEMAHIRRRDWLTQLLAQITCALYWFNPLVWWIAHQLHVECERACDDCVLLTGAAPSVYADTLLEVIRTMKKTPSFSAPVLSMARPPIEKRLRSILAPRSVQHRVLRRPHSVLICVLFVAGALPLAAIHVSAKPTPPPVPPISLMQPSPLFTAAQHKPTSELRRQSLLDQKLALTSARKPGQNGSRDDAALRQRLEKMERLLVQNQQENLILRHQLQQLLLETKAAKRQVEQKERANRSRTQPLEDINARRVQITALENMLDTLKHRHDVLMIEREQREQQVKAGVETTEKVQAIETQMAHVAVEILAAQQRLQAVRAGHKITPQEAERRTLKMRLMQERIALDSLEEQMKLIQARVDTGQISQTELTKAQADAAAIRTEIAQIEARLAEVTGK